MHNRAFLEQENKYSAETGSGRKPWKAMVSGIAAGLAATWVMTQYQVNSQKLISRIRREPPQQGGESTTVAVAKRVTRSFSGRELPPEWVPFAGNAVHYGFGASMGALYGILTEFLPAVSAGRGLAYGAAVWAMADEVALPAAGMAKWWPEYPTRVHANALAAHLVYASALDTVHRGLHSLLDLGQSRGQHRLASPSTRRFSRFGLERKSGSAE
jgi:putative membrane protein